MLVFKIMRNFLLVVLLLFFIKYFFIDIIKVDSSSMSPTIQKGDRVLYVKTFFTPFFRWALQSKPGQIILFQYPHPMSGQGCLRIAGIPHDKLSITNGILTSSTSPHNSINAHISAEDLLPAEFSPRDNFSIYTIPKQGDTILFQNCTQRDYIFLFSILRQENPTEDFELQPMLYSNDSLNNEFVIKQFSLYEGPFNAIPDSLRSNWFFWDKLKAYLKATHTNKNLFLTFLILNNKTPLTSYIIKHNYYFLISDNWIKGYDSRYFGPLSSEKMLGTIFCILWSYDSDQPLFKRFRLSRTIKFIH